MNVCVLFVKFRLFQKRMAQFYSRSQAYFSRKNLRASWGSICRVSFDPDS